MANYFGNIFLLKDGEMQYKPTADHSAVATEWMKATAGAAIDQVTTNVDCVEYQADGKWDQANATAEASANGKLAMALHDKGGNLADGDTFDAVLRGLVRDETWNWGTVGGLIYLHTTAGELTQTPPGSGNVVRIVGYVYDAKTIWFEPEADYDVIP